MDLAIFIVIAFALVCGALASLSQRQATNVSCFYPDGNAAGGSFHSVNLIITDKYIKKKSTGNTCLAVILVSFCQALR